MKNQLNLHLACKSLQLKSLVDKFPGLPFIQLPWLPKPFSSILL